VKTPAKTAAQTKTQRALIGIAGLSAAGTVLSRVTGLGRTVFQASALGAGGVSDAYNLANTTPNLIYDLVLGGILAGTLVPVFVRALNEDEDRGWEAISAVCTTIVTILAAVTVVFVIATPWIIRFYTVSSKTPTSGAERHLAVTLLYLFVPQLAMYGLTAVATAILAARRNYAYAMFAPVLNNVIVIAVLVAFAGVIAHPTVASVRTDHHATLLLGLGTTAGVVAMALALVPALWRSGARLRWVWNPRHPAVRTILRLSGWTAGVVISNQITLLVVILLANHTQGDYTAWQYAYQFFLLPHAIWMVSLLGPMEAELSHRWQAGDRSGARRHLVETVWSGMVLIVPAGLGYAALARPAISLVLLHGNMTAHGARLTADALAAFALGLPFFSVYAAFMRTYQAMQDTRTMFVIYGLENAINVVLALVLYPSFGVTGLAASWGLSYGAGAVVAAWHLNRRMNGIGGIPLVSALGRVVVAGAAAAGAAWLLSTVLAHAPEGTRQLGVAVRVLLAVGIGVTGYVLAADRLDFRRIRRKLLG
jgi:putative peptidoglycan lipid II flippase